MWSSPCHGCCVGSSGGGGSCCSTWPSGARRRSARICAESLDPAPGPALWSPSPPRATTSSSRQGAARSERDLRSNEDGVLRSTVGSGRGTRSERGSLERERLLDVAAHPVDAETPRERLSGGHRCVDERGVDTGWIGLEPTDSSSQLERSPLALGGIKGTLGLKSRKRRLLARQGHARRTCDLERAYSAISPSGPEQSDNWGESLFRFPIRDQPRSRRNDHDLPRRAIRGSVPDCRPEVAETPSPRPRTTNLPPLKGETRIRPATSLPSLASRSTLPRLARHRGERGRMPVGLRMSLDPDIPVGNQRCREGPLDERDGRRRLQPLEADGGLELPLEPEAWPSSWRRPAIN